MSEIENLVEIQNLQVKQLENPVLKDVNITIRKGEFIYLIGKTGSGKSSLLHVLYADHKLKKEDGKVLINGEELNGIPEKRIPFLRRKLGIVFQDFQLLTDRTVMENLLFVMRATGWKDKAEMKTRGEEVLNMVGLTNKGNLMPFRLSGGEQQRVAIARALLNNPLMVLADEPTGNLDPLTSEEIVSLLKSISQQGTAVLMATHDYSLFKKYPARTLVCENGVIQDSEKLQKEGFI